jgi:DNA invertase Pin-like site-specific DNA recombinase
MLGKSGLRIDGRQGLKDLIDVVQGGQADFKVILAYDVSRWGRFQDADESAYYEHICKRAGISVQYCAEQFENDGSPVSTIVKGVKRAMAGEYSRELSAKVFKGQCKLVELGFRQGGPAGYGLRRLLIDQVGNTKTQLSPGEQKSLQTDRVILVPGPEDERATVRRIYHLFIRELKTEAEIAADLNRAGLRGEGGREWTRGSVREVLTNEKYIGHNVYNRVSFKLKKKRVRNPPEMWVRHEGAFEPIVDAAEFAATQALMLERHRFFSDEQLLAQLKELANRHGRLSGILIDESEGTASSAVYRHRFGSLVRAYQLIGYTPERDYAFLETNRRLRQLHPEVVDGVVQSLRELGGVVVMDSADDLLLVNGMFSVSVVLCRCQRTTAGGFRWLVRFDDGLRPDITVAVRMDAANEAALDYYLLPSLDVTGAALRIREENGAYLDTYRFDTLDYFFGMAELVPLGDVA